MIDSYRCGRFTAPLPSAEKLSEIISKHDMDCHLLLSV